MESLNELRGHVKRNEALLQIFLEKQVSLEEPRLLELHFWAGNEASAAGLAEELDKNGFTILVLGPSPGGHGSRCWNVEAGWKSSIQSIVAEKFTEGLIDLASKHQAEYDGWGTLI